MAVEDLPRCFSASQLLERSGDAGGSADGLLVRGQEALVVREQGSHCPTSTSGRWMGEEKEGGELGV